MHSPLSLSSPAQAQVSQPWTSQWIGTKWKRQDQCRHCLTEVYRILLVWKDNIESVKKQFVHISPETPCTFPRLTTPLRNQSVRMESESEPLPSPTGQAPWPGVSTGHAVWPNSKTWDTGASEYAALNSKSQGSAASDWGSSLQKSNLESAQTQWNQSLKNLNQSTRTCEKHRETSSNSPTCHCATGEVRPHLWVAESSNAPSWQSQFAVYRSYVNSVRSKPYVYWVL